MSLRSTSTRPYFLVVVVPTDLIFEGRNRNIEFSNIILRDKRRKRKGKLLKKIRDKYPNRNPDQARRKRSNTLLKAQSSHRAGEKEAGSPPRDAEEQHSVKWVMRHKRSTYPYPHRAPTIKPGPRQRGPVRGEDTETSQERKFFINPEHLQENHSRGCHSALNQGRDL